MSELIACHHKVTLDIAKRDVCTIEVVNRDTANILEVNVCENGKEVSLENATLITITYSNDTVDEMQISEDFKTAFIRINANCLKRGINFAKVCIYSGDNGLITAEMLTINCKQTVGSDNPAVPDPDMPKLKEMIEELVKQSASSEQIAAAVSQYLKDNPITETDPTVPDWAKEKNKPTYTAAEVGALSEGTLDAAINTALAAAKASGEFDGADGITPTIGDNGNWYLGNTDTNKPSRGKSAYSYAQDGGYTGTEAEFAAKLAAEKPPNPYPLTFTGAVNETYDGSSAKTIEIPSGGSGSVWHTIGTQKMDGVETAVSFDLNGETIIQIIVTANYNEALTATKATVSLTLENGTTVNFTPQTMNATSYSPKNIFTIFGNSKQCRQMIFSKAEGVAYSQVQGSFGVAYGYNYHSEHMVEDKIATGITITFDQAPSNAAIVKVEGM